MSERPLLEPGRNCWRVERAHRLTVLVDAAAYFGALRDSLRQARRAVRIVGWDVDSRAEIVGVADEDEATDPDAGGSGEPPDDDLPRPLGDLLNALARRTRRLRIDVLEWDFPRLYATDRELLPVYALGWRTHRRVAFCLAGEHPVGASHHQKLVTVDDAVAYVGGIDLTLRRWDTPAHAADDPRRRLPGGAGYAPFHDLQAVFDGPAAAAMGEFARTCWQRATKREPCPSAAPAVPGKARGSAPTADRPADAAPWPRHVTPAFEAVDVAIARTEAAHRGRPAVHEVRQLMLDVIGTARRWLYIENQFFTSSVVADAVAERLQADDGPEIVVVTRRRSGGWLEEVTMSVVRARVLARLREVDRHGRLRVYFPDAAGLGDERIVVHSKLLLADDRLLVLGSANLNNRSLVLDTECCVALDAEANADPAAVSAAIAGLRAQLLAEHLGTEPDAVAAALRREDSLIGAIESLCGGPRTLAPLDPSVDPEIDGLVPESALVDPEQPVTADRLADELVPHPVRVPLRRRALGLALLLLALALTAAAWRWTPLSEWVDLAALAGHLRALSDEPLAPLWVLVAYLVGALLAVPVTLMILATALVFPAWTALGYALAGSLAAGALTFGLGQLLGRDIVGRLGGDRLNRLSRRLGRRGVLAMVTVRLLPLAPFTIVNLAAGASHIRLRDFLLGSLLGMLPGIVAITVFSDRLLAALRAPSPATLAWLAVVAAAVAAGTWGLRRWLRARGEGRRGGAGDGGGDDSAARGAGAQAAGAKAAEDEGSDDADATAKARIDVADAPAAAGAAEARR